MAMKYPSVCLCKIKVPARNPNSLEMVFGATVAAAQNLQDLSGGGASGDLQSTESKVQCPGWRGRNHGES